MSRRQRLRRRFLHRWTPYYGRADALRIWNGQDVHVERTLGQFDRISVRPASSDAPWVELASGMRDLTDRPPRNDQATGIRTMLRGLLAGRHQ